MAENRIELKSVGELLGMKFFIPSYQRGYRWREQQVKDLLNDIEAFRLKIDNNEIHTDDFYCLQPLVVKEKIVNIEEFINALPSDGAEYNDVLQQTRKAIAENTKWEVIDGQQRLTTFFILLNFLAVKQCYSIEYQTKISSNSYLNNITNSGKIDNIDNYHIYGAYETIKNWFDAKNDEHKSKFKETILRRVKFIWYESFDEDPINVFTRLNIGKIKLTNAELIKAMFLKRSNFDTENNNHLKLRQQEIASEWDNIEYSLQNDEFWLFLHEKDYERPTRIDFIFDLICEQNTMNLQGDKYNLIGSDMYKTFRYFYEYFNSNNSSIEYCWEEVKKYYLTFQEWFNDLELYHYVGYQICQGSKIKSLVDDWKGNKADFLKTIKRKTAKSIENCKNLNKQYELEKCPSKTQCKPILLLHNIQTVINQNKNITAKEEYKLPVFYKFPFHLYKKEKWDVEHIDSSTQNPLESEKDQKEWLKYASLDSGLNDELKQKIRDFIASTTEHDENKFEELSQEIDKAMGENGWDNVKEDKNKIWNFVLLDAGTNRGYGNAIFPAKRRCIIGKDQGIFYTIDNDLNVSPSEGAIAFIPPVTRNVFLKYYNTSEANFRVWTKSDAELYKANILEVLKDFGVTDDTNNNAAKQ